VANTLTQNLTAMADPLPGLRLAARWNHVGERGGFSGTGTIEGFDTVDLVATATKLAPNLTARASLKNLFDDDVLYITTLPEPFPIVRKRYDGRAVAVDLSYRF